MPNHSNTLNEFMSGILDRLRGMADADVVIGKAITTPDGTTVLPVSKITIGVASGGTDFVGKHNKDSQFQFGGGGGAGMSVEPVAFLIVSPNGVRLLPMAAPGGGAADRLIDMVPGVLSKLGLGSLFGKKKDDAKAGDEAEPEPGSEAL